jgi:hypothetical protein
MPDKQIGAGERHQATRGGEHIVIRRAEPQDKALYRDFLRDVSAEDLRLRFFAHIAELSAAEGDRLTHLDYGHDMVFVAVDEATGQMLGLVRLRDELDEQTAEFAVLVCSRLKGHGLGWLLMATCWRKTRTCCRCARSLAFTPKTLAACGASCLIFRTIESDRIRP